MAQFALCLYRFTDRQPAMIAFLEALGLRKAVTSEDDSFAIMTAAGGGVAIHSAAHSATQAHQGDTHLVFTTGSAEDAARHLTERGHRVTVWDESYGRHAALDDGQGNGIWINEDADDLYGYRAHPVDALAPFSVTAVRFSSDFAADRALFADLGFVPVGAASPYWEALEAAPESGVIGLHAPHGPVRDGGSVENPLGLRNPLVHLGFETAEPLQDVADRLLSAGYEARVVEQDGGSAVHVTDPDGIALEVHAHPGPQEHPAWLRHRAA